MKSIIQGLVLATLITTAQASPFPSEGEPVSLPAEWTHADRYAIEGSMIGSSFAGDGELVALPAQSTYADRNAGSVNEQIGSAFPGDGELVALPAQSTYADGFATDREQQAGNATAQTQAALSE